ncbi:MAG: NADH-quinone oxidoreductase subunit M [Thermoanaerobaculia bacterium]|nr:MAG: NADH-quinone oxidoreductase subunit M [Thermoanaerobaculia bacterium]MBZ0103156.1 NADH-quinone oxidoreductase subunit M [Thermoanaerobaculia bacterium]
MDAGFWSLLLGDSVTRLVFFPALAVLPLLLMRRARPDVVRWYALAVSLVEVGLMVAFAAGHWDAAGMRVKDPILPWVDVAGIRIAYEVGIDGISLPLVLLTGLLLPVVVLASWKGIEKHWSGFAASLFLLTSGILGALVALDLFVFYIFWEVMLVPMYLIIGIWGGERRVYAALKFFLFTMAGSLLMLLAILWMAWTHGQLAGYWSFRYEDLLRLDLPLSQQLWLFGAFALAFAIKVPMFPVHTWLPDAHVEAPTGGSIILAGILLKLGTYGFLRFALPLFPHAADRAAPWLLGLAVVGIIYGALVAWVQPDMKKLVAYSSVAHLGFVMLGILACDLVAWQGALLQMVNHGLSTGALFLLVGVLYDRRHTKKFEDFGGLAKVMPWFATVLVFSTLASVGLPGLNGFVGEFMILIGTWSAGWKVLTAIATFGVVLAAVYLMRMLQETIWGPLTRDENRGLPDLTARETLALLPLCVFMLWIGVTPQRFLEPSRPALQAVLEEYRGRLAVPPASSPTLTTRAAPAGADRTFVAAADSGRGGTRP